MSHDDRVIVDARLLEGLASYVGYFNLMELSAARQHERIELLREVESILCRPVKVGNPGQFIKPIKP